LLNTQIILLSSFLLLVVAVVLLVAAVVLVGIYLLFLGKVLVVELLPFRLILLILAQHILSPSALGDQQVVLETDRVEVTLHCLDTQQLVVGMVVLTQVVELLVDLVVVVVLLVAVPLLVDLVLLVKVMLVVIRQT
jgi:hypothetical protein